MNSPPIDGSLARDDSAAPNGRARERLKLARKWAYLLSQTAYLPWPHAELEQRLASQLDELIEAVTSEPFATRRVADVGMRLVEWRCIDPSSLQRTLDVLGKGLLSLSELSRVDDVARRVVAVFGALVAGYSDAMRLFVIEQQESINHALRNAEQNAKQDLLTSEARFDQVAECSPSGIAITDLDGHFVRTNAALGRILGYAPSELAGLSLFDVVRSERTELSELYLDLRSGRTDRLRQTGRLQRKDGGTSRVSLTASLMRSADGLPSQFVTVVEDATELTLLQDELLRQALHDVLTGLPNRQFFTTRLESVAHKANPVVGITLYHLDLDAFSLIVGGLGRRVGEHLLITVAERLRSIVEGERAIVARLESDEFAIVVENSAVTPDVASTVARINEELSEPVYIDGIGVAVSASIGVVHHPPADMGAAELLGAAEMTLRRAQRDGRRQWGLFDPDKDARDRDRFRLAAAMPGAWETGELRMVYQPLVRLVDDRVVGVEALLRWDHPKVGMLAHGRCVELAEQTGFILPLGRWLVRAACSKVAHWDWLDEDIALHVDLTANQSADPDLVGTILRTLDDTGFDAERLRLGMPVPTLLAEDGAAANLTLLADAGVGAVVRDFGVRPAGLACIEDLPVHSVRMAPWPVPPDETDTPGTAVLTALLGAVHAAGAQVIVDGVESDRQAWWWRRLGADVAQGDLFAPPGLSRDLEKLVVSGGSPGSAR